MLAIQVARGGREESPDKGGALRTIAEQPFGKGLLVLLAVGLAAYALWRLAQAILDRDNEGEGPKGLVKRAGNLGKAGVVRPPLRPDGLDARRQRQRRRQRAAADRRRLRAAVRALPRLRGRDRVPRRSSVQRLARDHLQVQQEAEDGADERCRGSGGDRSRDPRAPGADGRVRPRRRLPLQSGLGVRLEGGAGGSTARCSSLRSSPTAASSSARSRVGLFAYALYCLVQARYRRI